jgi:lipopolysaccharide transport system permease protein
VLFPDIKEILSAFIPLWRWTLPLIYPETVLPEAVRRWLFLNPPHIFIRSIRQLVLEQRLPLIYDWIIMSVWLWCLVWIGTIVHRKLQSEMKDNL